MGVWIRFVGRNERHRKRDQSHQESVPTPKEEQNKTVDKGQEESTPQFIVSEHTYKKKWSPSSPYLN
jgi:hypothetical protein